MGKRQRRKHISGCKFGQYDATFFTRAWQSGMITPDEFEPAFRR
jgi:hypothetical protein